MVDWLKENEYPKWKDIDAGAIYYGCSPDEIEQVDCDVKLFENYF